MRYFTFAQEIGDGNATELVKFLRESNIKYVMGADFSMELVPYDYTFKSDRGASNLLAGLPRDYLVNTFVILGEEDDLTAIKMRFEGITVLKNRRPLQIKNFFRKIFFM